MLAATATANAISQKRPNIAQVRVYQTKPIQPHHKS